MSGLIDRLRFALSPGKRMERRRVDALTAQLGVPRDHATWILRRARQVGYGAAMGEYERGDWCRDTEPEGPSRPR